MRKLDNHRDEPPRPCRRKRQQLHARSWIAVGVVLVIFITSALLLFYLLRDMDWVFLREIAPLYLALIFLLSVLGTALYTTAIYVLVLASGHWTTFTQAYLVLTASLSANYVTPVKAGIPLRVYLYNHFMHIPTATGTALVVLETFIGMLTPALIAIVGIASLFTDVGLVVPSALLVVLLAGTAIILYVKPKHIELFLRGFPWSGFTQRVARFVERVQAGLRSVPAWALVSISLLFTLNFVTSALQSYLVLRVLGYPVSPLALLYVLAISVTAGNLSLIPMGLGVRDASFTLLLMQLGVPNEVALSAAVIQRLFAPGWPLLLGVISTNILGVSELMKRGSSSAESTSEES